MAKIKKKEKAEEKSTAFSKFSLDKFIPEKYQTVALFGVILLIFMIYYSPMYFGGKTFQSGDIVTSNAVRSYIDNDREDFTLWYPYIFCGMPAYALAVDFKWFNLMYVGLTSVRTVFSSLLSVDYAMWTLYLLILAFTTYLLLHYLSRNRLISLFAGLMSSFSTGIIVFLLIGHVTKLTALCFFPLILLMLLKFEKGVKLRDAAILIITLQLALQGWHVQIIFYMMFAVAIYYLYNFIRSLADKKKEQFVQFVKSAGTFAAAFVIAMLIQLDNLTQIYEYNEYSTRGTKSIVESGPNSGGQSDSDFYQYATNWSFSPEEVATFIIPSYVGFGNSTYNGPLTGGRAVEVNTYFGQMPFVDVAMYMGIIVFFLALFSIYANWKNRFVQILAIISLIALVISFGRTVPFLYDLMFNYFPYFDKFRVPSMILVLPQLILPILAALGIHKIIKLKEEKNIKLENVIKYAAYCFTGFLLIILLSSGTITDWFAGRVNEHAQLINAQRPQLAQQYRALADYSAGMFLTDAYFAFGLTAAVFWFAFGYIKNLLSKDLIVILIIALSLFDLIRIDNRAARYKEAKDTDSIFVQPNYITTIKNDAGDEPYRMLNLKQDGSYGSFNNNSNFNAHFLVQDFYGYSAIKPRSFQDMMDVVGPVNPTLWRMLNIKYLVTDREMNFPEVELLNSDGKTFVYKNMSALPRAYFVDSVAIDTPLNTLNKIKGNAFDPSDLCFIHDGDLNIDKPGESANVTVKEFLDEKITIEVTATGNNLLFLGDTYYPKGWHAYVDGEETEILRVNHGFRGIIVPMGKHEVIFNYLPTSFTIAKYTSLILSTLTILGLIFGLLIEKKKTSEIIET